MWPCQATEGSVATYGALWGPRVVVAAVAATSGRGSGRCGVCGGRQPPTRGVWGAEPPSFLSLGDQDSLGRRRFGTFCRDSDRRGPEHWAQGPIPLLSSSLSLSLLLSLLSLFSSLLY